MKLEYVNKDTGEITRISDKYNQEMDRSTRVGSNQRLTEEQVVSLRGITGLLTGLQATAGIVTGIVLGKTLFTGVCISVGASILYDMITPTDLIYKKVLTFKQK